MDNTPNLFIVPSNVENLQLPDPGLLQVYKDFESRILWIDCEITTDSISYVKKILEWNHEDEGKLSENRKPIKLMFMSPGGDLEMKNTLRDIIKLSKTPIYGYAIGMVASAAAYTFLACHKKFGLSKSCFLFHKGSCSLEGDASNIMAFIGDYQRQLDELSQEIMAGSTFTAEEIKNEMQKDWYVSASLALEKKILDKIITDIDELL
jgi:ATP-dependent Clp protease, protease subunit